MTGRGGGGGTGGGRRRGDRASICTGSSNSAGDLPIVCVCAARAAVSTHVAHNVKHEHKVDTHQHLPSLEDRKEAVVYEGQQLVYIIRGYQVLQSSNPTDAHNVAKHIGPLACHHPPCIQLRAEEVDDTPHVSHRLPLHLSSTSFSSLFHFFLLPLIPHHAVPAAAAAVVVVTQREQREGAPRTDIPQVFEGVREDGHDAQPFRLVLLRWWWQQLLLLPLLLSKHGRQRDGGHAEYEVRYGASREDPRCWCVEGAKRKGIYDLSARVSLWKRNAAVAEAGDDVKEVDVPDSSSNTLAFHMFELDLE